MELLGRSRTRRRPKPLYLLGVPAFFGLLWSFEWWRWGESNPRRVAEGTGAFGYNAANGEFGDMIEFGILDPTKVTRTALQNKKRAQVHFPASTPARASG